MHQTDSNKINTIIGNNITSIRKKYNLSQREICEAIGINRNTYKDYETGRRMIPISILSELAKLYMVSYNYFFNDMPDLNENESRELFDYKLRINHNYFSNKYPTLDLSSSDKILKYFEEEQKKIQNKVRIKVKKLRLDNNKTQDEIAKYLDVDKSTYNKYENGSRKFSNDVIKRLADYYNISINNLID